MRKGLNNMHTDTNGVDKAIILEERNNELEAMLRALRQTLKDRNSTIIHLAETIKEQQDETNRLLYFIDKERKRLIRDGLDKDINNKIFAKLSDIILEYKKIKGGLE